MRTLGQHPSRFRQTSAGRFRSRRGAVLVMALVCLALITAIGGALLRWALMEHKLLRSREQASQARWLAEAGVERAAARLAAAKGAAGEQGQPVDYAGETWLVPAADLPDGGSARVRLRVVPMEEGRRSIEVEVEYPFESGTPVRAHKQVVYEERKP